MQVETSGKRKGSFSDSASQFVIKIVAVYVVWKLLHYFLTHTNGIFHQGWERFIVLMGTVYAAIASHILNLFGEHTIHYGITVYYPESLASIHVEDHCLAIPATIIFTGSILLFSGDWKNKLWFIPLGIAAITVINLIRLVLLCETFVHFSETFFEINHSVIYVIVVYTLILMMIVWWMKRFNGAQAISN